ncbi:MAG: galactofuranose transport system permease protein, partial [Pseudonocardiales bacterium]|nr:galactofuranose transport system permease protein [Pseudonocardiales bacterium]
MMTTTATRTKVLQRQGAAVALILMVTVSWLVFPRFGSLDNLRDLALQGSFLVVIALGMTFVIITGGIDLSVGSLYALGGVLAAWGSQYGFLVALTLPLLVCGVIGLINGLLIARTNMAPFIVTLASLLFARGLLLAITDEGADTYQIPPDSAFVELGRGTVALTAAGRKAAAKAKPPSPGRRCAPSSRPGRSRRRTSKCLTSSSGSRTGPNGASSTTSRATAPTPAPWASTSATWARRALSRRNADAFDPSHGSVPSTEVRPMA